MPDLQRLELNGRAILAFSSLLRDDTSFVLSHFASPLNCYYSDVEPVDVSKMTRTVHLPDLRRFLLK